jgi:nucleolar protein 58
MMLMMRQLIYHASLIGQATGKNKGKIARMLAAKSALGLRIDALSDWGIISEDTSKEPSEEEKAEMGRTARAGIERRLRALEGKPLKSLGNANQTPLAPQMKFDIKEARKYNPDADGLTGDEPAAKKSKTTTNGTNGTTPKKALVQEVESEEEDEDTTMADVTIGASESDSESAEEKTPKKGEDKAVKKAEKEAKKARKAERAAKRQAKEAKKAAKEAKKAVSETKRKREDDGDKAEKKKKKKSKD